MTGRRSFPWLLSAAVALALAALLAACGADATPTPPPTATATPRPVQAAATATPTPDRIAQLYEAAKKEGKVVVFTNDDVYARIGKRGFTTRFPGIAIETESGTPTERASKVIAQERAGAITTDLLQGSARDVEPVVTRGLAVGPAEIDWRTLGYLPEFVLADGTLPVNWNFVYAHQYNTKLLTKADLPKTLADLKDPKWRGKITSSPFLYPAGWAFISLKVGEAEGVKQAKALFDAAQIKLSDASQSLVNSGEASINLFSSITTTIQEQRKGASIEYFFTPEGMGTAQLGFVTLKQSPHPNAARLYIYWINTPEGQKAMFDETAQAMAAGTGVDTEISRAVKAAGITLVLENDANWRERARLTGVVRVAVIGQ